MPDEKCGGYGWGRLQELREASTPPSTLPFALLSPQVHSAHVWSVALTSDGRRVVSGDADGRVCLWDLGTGERRRKMEVRGGGGRSGMRGGWEGRTGMVGEARSPWEVCLWDRRPTP